MIRDLYPFSTSDGKIIPLDIVRPVGTLRIAFSNGVASAPSELGAAIPIVLLKASADCFVSLGGIAVIPGASLIPNLMHLFAGDVEVVAPRLGTITVIGDGGAGNLTATVVEQWAGLGHENKSIAN